MCRIMATKNNVSTTDIIDIGINYIIEKLGTIETERFISILIREKSDYTKWFDRREASQLIDREKI